LGINQTGSCGNLAGPVQVAGTISRGLMKRSFLAWQRLAQERWWKNQLVMREREVALLEGKIRGFEKRPIQVRLCASDAAAACAFQWGENAHEELPHVQTVPVFACCRDLVL
jgi:hypothetical protein